jgi:membrane protease YdiL (CAAX protease family)
MNSQRPDGRLHGTPISRSTAILVACGIPIFIAIADGFFKAPLYRFSAAAFWVFDFTKFVLITVVLMVWLARAFSVTPASYGLRPDRKGEDWFHIVGLTVFLAILLYVIYQFVQHLSWAIVWRIFHPEPGTAFYKSTVPDGLLHYPVLLYLAVTAGFAEEVFFRALPLLYFRERYGTSKPNWIYVVTTSLLFGAAHWENGAHEVIATFAYGIAASVFYLKLKDLWPLVGAHALIDFWDFS